MYCLQWIYNHSIFLHFSTENFHLTFFMYGFPDWVVYIRACILYMFIYYSIDLKVYNYSYNAADNSYFSYKMSIWLLHISMGRKPELWRAQYARGDEVILTHKSEWEL